jgi:hypothetical protein
MSIFNFNVSLQQWQSFVGVIQLLRAWPFMLIRITSPAA